MNFQNKFAGWLTTDKENERLARVGAIISGHRRPNISNRSLGNAPSAVAYLSLGVTQRVATNLAWHGLAWVALITRHNYCHKQSMTDADFERVPDVTP
jgi:hypothetical protein